jgi:beta-lactam-binding protein with PASTA domain
MSLKEFVFSRVFAKHLGIAIAIAVGVILILLIWFNIYTRHGQKRTVPDFYAQSMEEVRKTARKSKMQFQVMDSVYTTAVGRGCVAEQNPKAGMTVKKWRTIHLTINAFNPEMVKVPDISGLPKRQAAQMLQTEGLEPGQLIYVPDISVDFVLRFSHDGRELHPGDSLQKGSVVDLILGRGLSNERTAVPDLTGRKLERARNMILASSLNLGSYIFDGSVITKEDSADAFVYRQIPEFRESATLQLGSSLYIWLTVDSAKISSDSLVKVIDTIQIISGHNNQR